MYLNQLDKEKQELFLDLSIHASLANNDLVQEEQEAIDAYCVEMNLPKSDYQPKKELDVLLEELKNKCNPVELNIVFIEITALIMSDSVYDTLEEKFMKHLQERFEISDDKAEKTLLAINQLKKSYLMLNEILLQ